MLIYILLYSLLAMSNIDSSQNESNTFYMPTVYHTSWFLEGSGFPGMVDSCDSVNKIAEIKNHTKQDLTISELINSNYKSKKYKYISLVIDSSDNKNEIKGVYVKYSDLPIKENDLLSILAPCFELGIYLKNECRIRNTKLNLLLCKYYPVIFIYIISITEDYEYSFSYIEDIRKYFSK